MHKFSCSCSCKFVCEFQRRMQICSNTRCLSSSWSGWLLGGRYFLCCSTPASRQSSLQSGLLPNLTQSRPLSGKSASAPLSKHISPNFRTCRMFHLFISPCHGASYQLIINPCINWRFRLQLKYFFLFLDVSNSQFQRTLQNAWTRILAWTTPLGLLGTSLEFAVRHIASSGTSKSTFRTHCKFS